VFLHPLSEASTKDHKQILKPEEVKLIFSVIETIKNLNLTLSIQLEERMKNWGPDSCVGDIINKNSAFLKMYSTYINGFSNAMVTISKCKDKNSDFANFLENATKNSTNKLDLHSYLIMPVQRLPRYVLLLTELLKHTPTSHPGHHTLTEALGKVKEVADFVNEAKRSAENAQEVLAIQESLSGDRFAPIMAPHRKFETKGTVTYYQATKSFRPKPLQYFLFNDLIVLCWPAVTLLGKTLSNYKVVDIIKLYKCEIEDIQDRPLFTNAIVFKASEEYTLGFESSAEKEKWVSTFNALKAKSKPRRGIISEKNS